MLMPRLLVARVPAVALLVLVVATVLAILPAPATADTQNPPWQRRCPQRIVLVLDLSESMEPNLGTVKQSSSDLIDALRGTPNQVAVVTFGSDATVAVAPADVGDDDVRKRVKEQVNDLEIYGGELGATNWEAAFAVARGLRPDLVVFVTDGLPSAHHRPGTQEYGVTSPAYLASAVQAADTVRNDGTRIVGLGLGLAPDSVDNLIHVTGPVAGEDFYQTDSSDLLNRLYEIAGKTCGVPVAVLPQPEPGTFPFFPVLATALGAVVLAVAGGLLRSRRRSRSLAPVLRSAGPLPDPSIRIDDPPPTPSISAGSSLGAADPAPPPVVPPGTDLTRRGDGPRHVSLDDRIRNAGPPSRGHPDETNRPGR